MKLILLLIAFAATVLVIHADPPIIFKTDFTCRQHEGRWCAAAYYYELDSSSRDDPLLHFRFCTTYPSKTVQIRLDPLGGDGGVWGIFQNEYEIGYKVFHTCAPTGRSCSHNTNEQVVPYYTDLDQTVHNALFWPQDSYEEGSSDYVFPNAFSNLREWYSNPPPMNAFEAMDGIESDDEVFYWTPEKSGTL